MSSREQQQLDKAAAEGPEALLAHVLSRNSTVPGSPTLNRPLARSLVMHLNAYGFSITSTTKSDGDPRAHHLAATIDD